MSLHQAYWGIQNDISRSQVVGNAKSTHPMTFSARNNQHLVITFLLEHCDWPQTHYGFAMSSFDP
jgi:hypothetical protein